MSNLPRVLRTLPGSKYQLVKCRKPCNQGVVAGLSQLPYQDSNLEPPDPKSFM
jgi:hypothetical protein